MFSRVTSQANMDCQNKTPKDACCSAVIVWGSFQEFFKLAARNETFHSLYMTWDGLFAGSWTGGPPLFVGYNPIYQDETYRKWPTGHGSRLILVWLGVSIS